MRILIISATLLVLTGCASDEQYEHAWADAEYMCSNNGGVARAFINVTFLAPVYLSAYCKDHTTFDVSYKGWKSTVDMADTDA